MGKTRHNKRRDEGDRDYEAPDRAKDQDHRKDKKFRNALRCNNYHELSRLEDDEYDDVYS